MSQEDGYVLMSHCSLVHFTQEIVTHLKKKLIILQFLLLWLSTTVKAIEQINCMRVSKFNTCYYIVISLYAFE